MSALLESQRKAASTETLDELVGNGHHPVHAIYTETTNLATAFAEDATALPPLHCAFDFLEKSQETYMPGYPPMSPLTVSYYAAWTLFDVRFGRDQETLGDCLAELTDLLQIDPIRVEALDNLRRSRMGIYNVLGGDRGRFALREQLTGQEFDALIPSGFKDGTGSIIFTRLLPPIRGLADPHIATTTPYVLVGQTEAEWIEYFGRHQIYAGAVGAEERLREHLKHGLADWYWAEYIFNGFLNHRSDAIFLTGVPDRPETQPHHKKFNASTVRMDLLKDQMSL